MFKIAERNVPDSKRFSNLTDDMTVCIYCKRPKDDLHEIFNGPFRNVSKRYGMVVPLCREHHRMVHDNPQEAKKLKAAAQKVFVEERSYCEYMEVFKINYVE